MRMLSSWKMATHAGFQAAEPVHTFGPLELRLFGSKQREEDGVQAGEQGRGDGRVDGGTMTRFRKGMEPLQCRSN